jgi:hypothetical protein
LHLERLEDRIQPAPIVTVASGLHAQEGTAVSGVVAHFSELNPLATAANFSASIDWGDGHVTSGTIHKDKTVGPTISFSVSGSNTYAEEGADTVTVAITPTGAAAVSATGALVVADAPLHLVASLPPSPVEGQPLSNVVVAKFTDADPGGTAADYTAQITWGDGTTGTGTVSADPQVPGTFDVAGSHTCPEEGTGLPFTVTIKDSSTTSISFSSHIQVADAPLTGSVTSVHSVEGATFGGLVATFTDADPAGTPADYTATVVWGDGKIFVGTITQVPRNTRGSPFPPGTFLVSCSHLCAREGSFPVSVQVSDHGAQTAFHGTLVVDDAPVVAGPATVIQAQENHTLGTLPLVVLPGTKPLADIAFFTDPADPQATAADYTAKIDWGDGSSPDNGVISLRGPQVIRQASGKFVIVPGGFEVRGSHAYHEEGNFTAHVTVTPAGGSPTVITNTVHVADAPLVPLGINGALGKSTNRASDPPLTATEGVAMPQTEVATFIDTDPSGTVSDYTAAIDWGDGHTTAGTVQFVAGSPGKGVDHFIVSGANTYTEDGTFLVAVSIADSQDPSLGQPLIFHRTIQVSDQALQAVATEPTVTAVEGVPLSAGQEVAQFLDPNTNATAGDFVVQAPGNGVVPGVLVNFGNGNTDIGTVVKDADNAKLFHVQVSSTGAGEGYQDGIFDLVVTISDRGGAVLTTHSPVQVSDAPLTLQSPTPVTATALQPFQAALGTFVDGSTSTLVHDTDEQVTVNWGDGTTTSGSVQDNGDGTFSVIGSHTYLTQTTTTPEQISVTVKDPAGKTLSFTTTATVLNAANALAGALQPEFDSLQANLNSKIFSNPLPLVGRALAKSPAGQIVHAFETGIVDGAQAASGGDFSKLVSTLTTELGNLVVPFADGKKVEVTTEGSNGHIAEVHLRGQTTIASTNVDLDLGLPGLPFSFLTGNAGVNLSVGFDLDLQFGIHDNGQIFIQTKPNKTATPPNPFGLLIDISANIAPGSSITADLGLFQLTLTQGNDPAKTSSASLGLSLGFSSNLSVGSTTFQTPQLTGSATINAQTSLTLLHSSNLPSLSSDFHLSWTFGGDDPTSSKALGQAPLIQFNHVKFDFGGFLTQVVSPVIASIQKFTEPLEPLADFLTTPIPLLSDVTSQFGQPPFTMADLIGGTDGPSINACAFAIKTINTASISGDNNLVIDLGSFTVSDPRAQGASGNPVTKAGVNNDKTLQQNTKALQQAGGFASNLATSGKFHIPLLEHPLDAFGIFLGQPVDLVTYTLSADITAGFDQQVILPLVPGVALNADFDGSFTLHSGVTFALSTQGLVTGNLLDSLQIQDAHIDMSLNIGVGAGLTIVVVSADLVGNLSISDSAELVTKDHHSTTITGTDLIGGNFTFDFGQPKVKGTLEFVVQLITGQTLFSIDLASFQVTL